MNTETTPSIVDMHLLRRLARAYDNQPPLKGAMPFAESQGEPFSPSAILRFWNLGAIDDQVVDWMFGAGHGSLPIWIVPGNITERGDELIKQAVAESTPEVTG